MLSFFKRFFAKSVATPLPATIAPRRVATTASNAIQKNESAATTTTPTTSTSGIPFDPTLIDKLKGDHAEMIVIYSRILNSAQTSQLALIRDDLILFRRIFQGHILMESVRFYVYLDRLLGHDIFVRDEARAVRKDMNGIAKAVADFIHNWITIPITDQTLPTFIEQLQGIGGALVARVELEEQTLYTLYTESL